MTDRTDTATEDLPTAEEMRDYAHVGPDKPAGKLLRTFWTPVLASADLKQGRAIPLRMLGEDFTLFRGKSGKPHATQYRCAHRGTQLSAGWVEDDSIRCRYHGWKYDGKSGQCVDQPGENFASKIKIRTYPTYEYIDLIWVYFGEGEPPELPHYPSFEDRELAVREVYQYKWPMNYFNAVENDPFHPSFTHKEMNEEHFGRRGYPTITCAETEYGSCSVTTPPPGEPNWPKTILSYFLMPYGNVSQRPLGEMRGRAMRQAIAFRVPMDDTNMHSLGLNMTFFKDKAAMTEYLAKLEEKAKQPKPDWEDEEHVSQRILKGELTIEDVEDRLLDFSRWFHIEDYVVQVGQGAIASRGRGEHLGPSIDANVIVLRKIYRREMSALVEGKPLTKWRLPKELVSVPEGFGADKK